MHSFVSSFCLAFQSLRPLSLPPPSIFLFLLLALQRANVKTMVKAISWNRFVIQCPRETESGHIVGTMFSQYNDSFLYEHVIFLRMHYFDYYCKLLTVYNKLGGLPHLFMYFMRTLSLSLLDWSCPSLLILASSLPSVNNEWFLAISYVAAVQFLQWHDQPC